jgi:hypothetical protein
MANLPNCRGPKNPYVSSPSSAPDMPASMPLPVCCIGGVPECHWAEVFQSDEDLRQFWVGYALGGMACGLLLIVEFLAIWLWF